MYHDNNDNNAYTLQIYCMIIIDKLKTGSCKTCKKT